MADEQPVVAARRPGGPVTELEVGDPQRGEPLVEGERGLAHQRSHQHAPAIDAVFRVGQMRRIDAWIGTAVQLGTDLQVLRATVRVVQLGGQRTHQRPGQGVQVGVARPLVLVEQHVPERFDSGLVPGEYRSQQAVSGTEVVVQRVAVTLPGATIDLPQ